MTFKEFKIILDSLRLEDNARVYVEQPLGKEIFLQTEASLVRREQDDVASYLIIEGKVGDQS